MILEDQLVPYNTETLTGVNVLALAPHPDDETFGCGGSLALHRKNQDIVKVVIVTDGCMGDASKDKISYIALREQECIDALKILGVDDVEFWGIPDRQLAEFLQVEKRLVKLIDQFKPELIYAPSPMEIHPDHRALAYIAWDAVKKSDLFIKLAYYEVNQPFKINTLVDISDVISIKNKAADIYKSQLEQRPYKDIFLGINKFRVFTLPFNVTHAEGFWVCDSKEIKERSLRSFWVNQFIALQDKEMVSGKPLVSVIIRTCNRPGLLREAILSVLDQTYPYFEIVIVNDGTKSIDHIIEEYKDQANIICINHKISQGRAGSANSGLNAVSGKYINFLDDDDRFYPEHLEKLVDYIEFTGADAVYSQCDKANYLWVNGAYTLKSKEPFPTKPFSYGALIYGNFIPCMTILFNSCLLESSGSFDESFEIFEDWDFWIRLCKEKIVKHLSDITAEYRHFEGGTVGTTGRNYDIHYWARKLYKKYQTDWPKDAVNVFEYLKAFIEAGLHKGEQKFGNIINQKEHQLNIKTQEISVLNNQLNEKNREIEFLQNERNREVESLQTQIHNANEHIGVLNNQLDDKGLEIDNKVKEIDGLHKTIAQKASKEKLLNDKIEVLYNEKTRLESELHGCHHIYNNKNHECIKLQKQVKKHKDHISKLAEFIDHLLSENNDLKNFNQFLGFRNNELIDIINKIHDSKAHRVANWYIKKRNPLFDLVFPVSEFLEYKADDFAQAKKDKKAPVFNAVPSKYLPLIKAFSVDYFKDKNNKDTFYDSPLLPLNTIPIGNNSGLYFPWQCDIDDVCRIDAAIGTYMRINPGSLVMNLCKEDDLTNIIRRVSVNAVKIGDGDFVSFSFEPVKDSKNCRFTISLVIENGFNDKPVALWTDLKLHLCHDPQYRLWQKGNEFFDDISIENMKNSIKNFEYLPVISILTPVYKVKPQWLEETILSVINQVYPNWELCLVDDNSEDNNIKELIERYAQKDSRIKFKFIENNNGISGASNHCLDLASGDFIALLDHDDLLSLDALFQVVKLLNEHPDAEMIYSDEDKLTLDGVRTDPFFKPDWSPDLLLSIMYTCHLSIYKKSLVMDVGGFRKGVEGSQDHDLALHISEKTDKIYHIPKILYHWRKVSGSTADVYSNKSYAHNASIKVLEDTIKRRNLDAVVEPGLTGASFRIRSNIKTNPVISIIIPFKDKVKLLKQCIDSIIKKAGYKNYEIICMNNQSRESDTLSYLKEIEKNSNIRVIEFDRPFNFSAINNYAVTKAKGDYILFLNNDMKAISYDWLLSMLEHAQRKEVGAVGAKLIYENNTIQHAGIVIGVGGVAGHAFKHIDSNIDYYFGMPSMIRNVSGVTAACLMTRKSVFEQVEGFDEKNLKVAFNDVDLCLKIITAGYRIIYTPFVSLYHYESISRGYNLDIEEVDYMKRKWKNKLNYDPFYNINLSKIHEDWSLNLKNDF